MRIQRINGYVNLWLSKNDTYQWATRPNESWPCSFLSGKSLFAQFAPNGDLVDMAINGGRGEQDCDSNEFNAITSDYIKESV